MSPNDWFKKENPLLGLLGSGGGSVGGAGGSGGGNGSCAAAGRLAGLPPGGTPIPTGDILAVQGNGRFTNPILISHNKWPWLFAINTSSLASLVATLRSGSSHLASLFSDSIKLLHTSAFYAILDRIT